MRQEKDISEKIKTEELEAIRNLKRIFPDKKLAENQISAISRECITSLEHLQEANNVIEQKENELQETKKTLEEYIKITRTINHDLRTPIGNLCAVMALASESYKQLMEKFPELINSKEGKDFSEILDIATQSSEAMFTTFNFYSDITRNISSNKKDTQTHNLNNIILDIYSCIKSLITEPKNITLQYKTFCGEQNIYADKNKLAVVLNNLVSNSTKFTPEGKNIYIISEEMPEDKGYVKISVQDEGKGISPEVADILFHKEATTCGINGEKGTGTGLLRCMDTITEMGGKIWIDQTSKDGGTKISFTIPKYIQ